VYLSTHYANYRYHDKLSEEYEKIYNLPQLVPGSDEYWEYLEAPCKAMYGDQCNSTLFRERLQRLSDQLKPDHVHDVMQKVMKASLKELPLLVQSFGSFSLSFSKLENQTDEIGQKVPRFDYYVNTSIPNINYTAFDEFRKAGMIANPVLTVAIYQVSLGVDCTHEQLIEIWIQYMVTNANYLYAPGFAKTLYNNTYYATDGTVGELAATPTYDKYGPVTATWFTFIDPSKPGHMALQVLTEPSSETFWQAYLAQTTLARTADVVHMTPIA